MRAGFDAPADGSGDEELSAIAAVWRDARSRWALTHTAWGSRLRSSDHLK
jgi:hypothetical protein